MAIRPTPTARLPSLRRSPAAEALLRWPLTGRASSSPRRSRVASSWRRRHLAGHGISRRARRSQKLDLHVVGVIERFRRPAGAWRRAEPRATSRPLPAPDFYLARVARGRSPDEVAASLRGRGAASSFSVTTIAENIRQEQRGLTAVNLHGLSRIEVVGAGLIAAIGVGVLGAFLVLERRRELAILRTLGATLVTFSPARCSKARWPRSAASSSACQSASGWDHHDPCPQSVLRAATSARGRSLGRARRPGRAGGGGLGSRARHRVARDRAAGRRGSAARALTLHDRTLFMSTLGSWTYAAGMS